MSEASTSKTAAPPVNWPGEIIIEIGDMKNRCMVWPPIQGDALRGAFDKERVPFTQRNEEVERLPVIPGMHIRLDCRRRVAEVYDPLTRDRYQGQLGEIQKTLQAVLNRREGPADGRIWENMSDNDMKLWLYWVRRFLDGTPCDYRANDKARRTPIDGGPQARVVNNATVPTMPEILALPGRIRTQLGNQSHTKHWRDDV